jgi:thymidylate synthase ThyX
MKVEIVTDSVNIVGNRLTTFVCEFQRFILPEVLTHRALSRSSSSSRAIPTKRLIDAIAQDTAMPAEWGLNNPGMQSLSVADGKLARQGEKAWLAAKDSAIWHAKQLAALGFHKQIVNRVIEPYMQVRVVISGTEWGNFFTLRCHPDAQPEFRSLATAMQAAMLRSEPILRRPNEWHIPFILGSEANLDDETKLKISTARCARASYTLPGSDKPSTLDKDLQLYDRLIHSEPKHCSPSEHQALAMDCDEPSRNFRGFHQHRIFVDFKD